jgi:hypothetical protein
MRRLFRPLLLILALTALAQPAGAREIVRKGDTVVVALNGEVAPARSRLRKMPEPAQS